MSSTSIGWEHVLGGPAIAALGSALGSLSALALACSLIVLGVLVVGLVEETRRRAALRRPASVPDAVSFARTPSKRAA
jgi:hypothetical protein